MRKNILQKLIVALSLVFLCYQGMSQSPLYSGVRVSDVGSSNTIGEANTSRNVAVDASGNIGVVYIGSSGLRFAKSINRGQSFLPSVQLSTATSGNTELQVADNGNIYVVYSNGSTIILYVSQDGGATFSAGNTLGTGSTPHIASFGSNVYVVTQSGNAIYRNANNGVGAFSSVSLGSWAYADIRVDKSTGDVYMIADNPTLYMFRSTNSGASFTSVPITGSVFYSSYSLTNGPLGKFIYVGGSATAGYRINFATGAATAIPVGNNLISQARTLESDEFGNFVDGYAIDGSTMGFRVSNNLGVNYGSVIAVAGSNQHNVARNASKQDVVMVYRSSTDNQIYLNTYPGLLLGLTTSGQQLQYCLGATGTINYSASGSLYNAGNEFIAQLSDANRSFASPTTIGSVTSTAANGTINITIPASIPSGDNYRIRVISTNSAATGADNGFDIGINSFPTANITAGGATSFCQGGSVVLTAGTNILTGSTYLWTNGDNTRSSTITQSGAYRVTVTNSCGNATTSSPLTVTVNPLPTATISKVDLSCAGTGSITVTPTAGTAPYQYAINGGTYQSSNVFNGLNAGTYNVSVRDANTCASTVGSVTLNAATSEINITGNGVTIVKGDATPSATDNTGFGSTTPGAVVSKNFVIQNTGTAPLNIAAINVSGTHATEFTVSGISFPATIAAGSNTSFTVNFTSATVGTRSAVITVNNSDCDEASYDFAVNAVVTCIAPSFANTNVYIQQSTSAGSCDAVVNYALSVSGSAPNVTYTFTGATARTGTGTGSGQVFNKGVTNVTVQAVNACGSPSVAFTVTVVDDVKPVVITKNINLYLTASGQVALNPVDLDNGSSDNCGQITFSSSNSGTICASAAEGSYLTLSAPAGKVITSINFASYGTPTGSCGNYATGSCHASSSVAAFAGAIGQNSFTIQASNTVFGDPCGGTVKWLYVQATYGFSSAGSNIFGCNNLGPNTVELTVRDAEGNTEVGTAIVTVIDAIKPTVITRNLTLCLDVNGNAVITPAQVNNGSTDNCSGTLNYSLSQTNFNSSHVGANTVTLSVTDASGNVGTATATVTINPVPVQYTVTGGGAYCSGMGGVAVELSNSEYNFTYQLKRNGTVVSTLTGTGAALNFGNQTVAGSYTVTAINTATSCTANMNGSATVVMNVLPAIYTVSGGGAYCAGGTGVTVSQNGSQSGISYQLKRDGTTVSTLAGTNGSLNFGNQTVAGVYTVVATNNTTSCTSNMSGSATVVMNVIPVQYAVTGGGAYCVGSTGVAVGLDNSQPGVNYLLKRDATNVTTLPGTGAALNFGIQTVAGTYTVVATNVTTNCTSSMTGNAVVVVNAKPVVSISPSATAICFGGSVTLTASQNVSTTRVYYIPVSGLVGMPNSCASNSYYGYSIPNGITWLDNGSGTVSNVKIDLSVGVECNATASTRSTSFNDNPGPSYTATVNACICAPAPQVRTINFVPTNYVTGGTNTFMVSNTGNSYGLIINPSMSNSYAIVTVTYNSGSAAAMNSWVWTPGGETTPGVQVSPAATTTYSVTGTDDNGCTGTASSTVTVNPLPNVYAVTGGGISCGNTVAIGLAASQSGIRYQLMRGATAVGSPVNGNGSAISFVAQSAIGSYTVVATNTTTGCTSDMTGTAEVTSGTAPVFSNIAASVPADTPPDGCAQTVSYGLSVSGVPAPAVSYVFTGATTGYGTGTGSGNIFNKGTTNVTVTASNGCGTNNYSFTVVVTDNIAPSITAPAAISVNNDEGACGAAVILGDAVTADNCGVNSVTNNSASFLVNGLFPVGITTVTWTVRDNSGLTTTATQTVTVTDVQDPVITAPSGIAVNNDLGKCGAAVSITAPAVTDNCGVYGIVGVRSDELALTADYPVGTTIITWTATDVNNRTSVVTQQVVVTDNEKPVITANANVAVNNDTDHCDALVTVNTPYAADNCAVSSVTGVRSDALALTAPYPVGITIITWTAVDVHNNTQTSVQTITVTDNQKPVIHNMPANIVAYAIENECSTLATWTKPTATDNCGGTISLVSNDSFYETLGFTLKSTGVHTITYTATDIHGNKTTASFTLTIIDDQPPVITGCPGNITVNAAAGKCEAIVNWNPPTASDNCVGVTFSTSHIQGSVFPVGTTEVTYTATDRSGNQTFCKFNVTVVDAEKPTISVPDITVNNDAGSCSAVVALGTPVTNDNCGIATVVNNGSASGVYPVGITQVLWTVTDIHNNTQTYTQTITVRDLEKPIVAVQDITVQLGVDGTVSITPAQINNGSTDNCGIAGMALSKTSFDCSNIGTNTVTLTVTDVHGNVHSRTAVVTVKDEVTAVVITKNIIVQLNASGAVSIVAADVDNGSNDACGIASMSIYPNSFTCANVGENTVTLTVTDVNGNVSSRTAVVTVKDEVAAVVITKNITVQLNASGTASIVAADIDNGSNDACGITSMSVYPNSFTCANVGNNTVTLTVTDVNGNVSSQTAVVTVKDGIAPVPTVTVLPIVKGQCAATVTVVPTAIDACAGTVRGVTNDPLSYSAQGTYIVHWSYTDNYGNRSYQDQTVIVKDTIAPVVTLAVLPVVTAECSAGVVIKTGTGCNDDCRCCRNGCHCRTSNCRCRDYDYQFRGIISFLYNLLSNYFNWDDENHECDHDGIADQVMTQMTTPTATDNCKGTILATTTDPLVYTTQGTHIIHWKFDDGNGNITIQKQTIIVKDNTAPVANEHSLPAISGNCTVTVTAKPTAKDNCKGTITGTTTDPLTYNVPGTYTIRWTYNDGNGNSSTQNQTVTVKDAVPPVPTTNSLPAISGNCSVTVTAVPTAKDNCGGMLTATTADPLTYTKAGTYTIRWSYTDGKNVVTQNQTVTVKDNTNPVPQVSSLPAITGNCSVTVTIIPKATDNCAGVITATTNSPLIYTAKGNYTIVWKYDDGNGNTVTQNQSVTVSDAVAPVISVPAAVTVSCGTATIPSATGMATATDNCGTTTVSYTDVATLTKITRTWKATDASGNSSTGVQTITIVDANAPVVNAPANVNVNCGASTSPSATGTATASDNCGTPSVSYTDSKTGNLITRTWKATDAFGNTATAAQKITIVDVTKPVVKCPSNITLSCGASTLPNNCGGSATATDNCDATPTISYEDITNGNVITRIWKATDDAGNFSTCTQTITFVDNTKPVLTEPNDITINCNVSTLPAVTGMATATDNCSTPVITYTDSKTGNVITRTWKATDASGNFITDIQKITIGTSFNPVITSVPTNNTYTGGVNTNLYIGYGAQSTKLEVCTLPSSGAPYTYTWSGNASNRLNSTSSAAPVFTPNTYGSFTFVVTVTNKYGCSYTDNISICVTDIRVPNTNGSKLYVCNTVRNKWGSPSYQTVQVASNQVSSYINSNNCDNGDARLGSCDQTPCNYTGLSSAKTTMQGITAEGTASVKAATTEEELKVTVMPNPSTTFFTLKLESKYETPVDLRVMDGSGRVVDSRSKLGANSTLQVGHNYSSGTYYAELIQGGKRKVVQLIKGRG